MGGKSPPGGGGGGEEKVSSIPPDSPLSTNCIPFVEGGIWGSWKPPKS